MATPPALVPDPVAIAIGAKVAEGVTAVTFRGWLLTGERGTPLTGGIYRLFTSPWHEQWLEIKKDDLLYQQPGTRADGSIATNDGASIVWVRRDAQVVSCEADEACHFADEVIEHADDPTATPYAAARRYPQG